MAPAALENARDRLRALELPALGRVAALIDHADSDAVRLAAARWVLEVLGHKAFEYAAPEQPSVHVTVLFDRSDDQTSTLSLPGPDGA